MNEAFTFKVKFSSCIKQFEKALTAKSSLQSENKYHLHAVYMLSYHVKMNHKLKFTFGTCSVCARVIYFPFLFNLIGAWVCLFPLQLSSHCMTCTCSADFMSYEHFWWQLAVRRLSGILPPSEQKSRWEWTDGFNLTCNEALWGFPNLYLGKLLSENSFRFEESPVIPA